MISILKYGKICVSNCILCGGKDGLNRLSSSKSNIEVHICDDCLKTVKIEKEVNNIE